MLPRACQSAGSHNWILPSPAPVASRRPSGEVALPHIWAESLLMVRSSRGRVRPHQIAPLECAQIRFARPSAGASPSSSRVRATLPDIPCLECHAHVCRIQILAKGHGRCVRRDAIARWTRGTRRRWLRPDRTQSAASSGLRRHQRHTRSAWVDRSGGDWLAREPALESSASASAEAVAALRVLVQALEADGLEVAVDGGVAPIVARRALVR